MGFHAGRRVVGLRIYISMAVVLGLAIGGVGYYAIFRTDLTDGAARTSAARSAHPNIVLVLLESVGSGDVARSLPTLAALQQHSLTAPSAYTAAEKPEVAMSYMVAAAGGGPDPRHAERPFLNAGYEIQGVAEDAAAVARWIARDAREHQPFFAVVRPGIAHGSPAEADHHLRLILEALTSARLSEDTVLCVTSLTGNPTIEPPERWHVPFVVQYARRFSAATIVSGPVSTSDVYPTLYDLAGVHAALPHNTPGVSVSALWLGRVRRAGVVIHGADARYAGDGDTWIMRRPGETPRMLNGTGTPDAAFVALLDAWE